VQSRRDQLQAYRFVNRRALAALVSGEPDVIDPPMRRLTVTTISGIMIAILIAVVFALLGVIKPTQGDKWRQPGSIIVERETAARYVLRENVLHPVLNYASAVLAVSPSTPHVVYVNRKDIKRVQRGPALGIYGLPDSLPSAKSLVTSPWTVCSRLQAGQNDELDANVSLLIGSDAGSTPVPAAGAILVRTVTDNSPYLLWQGQRLAISSGSVATSLGLQNAASVQVGTAFLDAVTPGPPLRAPSIPGAGSVASTTVDGQHPRVGQLLHVAEDNSDSYFLTLADGVKAVDPLQAALLKTLPIGPDRQPLAPLETSGTVALTLKESPGDWQTVQAQFVGLPDRKPTLADEPAQNGGICALYAGGSGKATFAVPPSMLPVNSAGGTVAESAQSRQGQADSIVLGPGRAAVVRSDSGAPTVFVVAEPGKKFAAASADVLSGFGYGGVTPVSLPDQLLPMIPTGPALDPAAATRPVTG
jgi:type VII secretion protein EccB